ncbi:hypothetical protein DFJ58DRAFT_843016 [Suillus subalutaceus]|uniref:uncharacterized protein n=1 Tax=Suillus subalutaceus TaxID=48586 RepID=UPI001B882B40|nr:uncharacterized protein DFJ58DRAFT_843016 [Suillus subalutaceus]KAG1848084.1 hypothetical protein DFJ58DRAFT_843016 [Suillus subalutaceus]
MAPRSKVVRPSVPATLTLLSSLTRGLPNPTTTFSSTSLTLHPALTDVLQDKTVGNTSPGALVYQLPVEGGNWTVSSIVQDSTPRDADNPNNLYALSGDWHIGRTPGVVAIQKTRHGEMGHQFSEMDAIIIGGVFDPNAWSFVVLSVSACRDTRDINESGGGRGCGCDGTSRAIGLHDDLSRTIDLTDTL